MGVLQKCMNALQQVTARDCRPIVICEKDDKDTQELASKVLEVPHTVDCLQVCYIECHFFVVIIIILTVLYIEGYWYYCPLFLWLNLVIHTLVICKTCETFDKLLSLEFKTTLYLLELSEF